MTEFRPWGDIDWLLSKMGDKQWSMIGCCGTEERSLSLALRKQRGTFNKVLMLAIQDPEPINLSALAQRLAERKDALIKAGFAASEVPQVGLITDLDEVSRIVADFSSGAGDNLILDITSLPKIWFFPVIQILLQANSFENIIVTYTSCERHADQLSGNAGPVTVLPGFFADNGRSQHDSIIVGIGFDPLGIMPLLGAQASNRVRLIFPFPPGPPAHRRNWMFVKQIETSTEAEKIDPPDRVHIHMYDCPQVFDALREMTEGGKQTAALAPYGPKTVSLAMCLFSIAANLAGRPRVPVFYAQPLQYNLDYSVGVRLKNGIPDTRGYCIRVGGRNLYTL